MSRAPGGPLSSLVEGAALAQVGSLLRTANYSAEGIEQLGITVGLGVRDGDVPYLERALRADGPLAALVRLFLLGREQHALELHRTLGDSVAVLLRAGFLERHGNRLRPTLRLTPWQGFLIAHDPDPATQLWADHVTGPNPAADTLAQLTVRVAVTRTLDMGTGSGLLALLAARHSERVVATDVNERALWLTSANAALNGLENVEIRGGSLFEPVAGEHFGLVVSNPPFVISPETELIFRFNDLPRDELGRRVVRDAAAHLEDGGFGHLLCNWIVPSADAWRDTAASWTEGTGCDALLLHHGTEDALAYAARWNLRLQQVSPAAYPETLDRWLTYYRREGIEAIASGAVILRRRRAGRNWTHALDLSYEGSGSASDHVRAIFAAQDYLQALADDRELLADAFRVADRHRLDQSLVFRDDRYLIQAASLVLEEGLGVRTAIDPDLVAVLFRLDGTTTLESIVGQVASEGGGDPAAISGRAVELVRRLLAHGFVEPVSVR